jgi:hypothetical protein
MNIPKDIGFSKKSEYNYAVKAPKVNHLLPHLDVITSSFEMGLVEHANTLIFRFKMLDNMYSGETVFTADTILMPLYWIKKMTKTSEDLTDSIKESAKKFVISNHISQYYNDGEDEQTTISIENLTDIDLFMTYAYETFKNLECVEFSLFGFSVLNLSQILNTSCEKQLNICKLPFTSF